MNSVIAALIVFLIRAAFVLYKKRVIPCLWGAVFLVSLCPFSLAGLWGFPENGGLVELFLGSSFKFYFFFLWEGLAAVLILSSFYRCRKRKWKALESLKLAEDVFVLEGLKRAIVCGFFHPVIYLPADLTEELQQEVLERKRRMVVSGGQKLMVLAMLVTYLNWFNPILWLSLFYLKEDLKRL